MLEDSSFVEVRSAEATWRFALLAGFRREPGAQSMRARAPWRRTGRPARYAGAPLRCAAGARDVRQNALMRASRRESGRFRLPGAHRAIFKNPGNFRRWPAASGLFAPRGARPVQQPRTAGGSSEGATPPPTTRHHGTDRRKLRCLP